MSSNEWNQMQDRKKKRNWFLLGGVVFGALVHIAHWYL